METPRQQECTTDLELVAWIAKRDQQAFASFYDRHAPRVFALLVRIIRNPTEAEDALQEVFVQVWREAARYDALRATPLAWLIQIARCRGIDHFRKIRLKNTMPPLEEIEPHLSDGAEALETTSMKQERGYIVRKALDTLSEEQRQALLLAFFDGLTHQDISKKLGIALGTIKTRIRLGLKKLSEEIQRAETIL